LIFAEKIQVDQTIGHFTLKALVHCILLTATCVATHIADSNMCSSTIQKKKVNIAFSWQEWLSEHSTILRYSRIVHFVDLFIEAGFHRRIG
jgi:hypothetical protein